jgi:hypothetical protein
MDEKVTWPWWVVLTVIGFGVGILLGHEAAESRHRPRQRPATVEERLHELEVTQMRFGQRLADVQSQLMKREER